MTEILLRSTIVLVFTWTVSQIARRSPAALRHLIWLSGLIAAAVLPLAFTVLPELDLPLLPARRLVSARPSAVEIISPPVMPNITKPPSRLDAARLWLKDHAVLALWLVGFAVTLMRFGLAVTAVRRLIRNAQPLSGPEWDDRLHRLCRRLSLTRAVRVLAGTGSFAPMVWGFLRCTILLPAETSDWTEERRHCVLAHELAHVKRYDAFGQLLTQIVFALFWFHPLVWFCAAQIRIERERACDDRVLNLGMNPHDYAGHLVEIARFVHPQAKYSYASMSMTHPSQLETRVKSILDNRTDRSTPTKLAAAIVLGTAALLTLVLGAARLTALPVPPQPTAFMPMTVQPQGVPGTSAAERGVFRVGGGVSAPTKLSSSEESRPAQTGISPALQKWLNDQVKYLISDQERQTFLSLPTNMEREFFIEQFWQRRDPTPNTPENEFKVEHDRRLAYANERFGYGNVPGWQTDRGHILIIHGKPDELESHPGPPSGSPFEIWTYRYLEGVGNNAHIEFIDPDRTGEYRLITGLAESSHIVAAGGRTIPVQVLPALSPKNGQTDVALTIQVPYSALSCLNDNAFRLCDVRMALTINRTDGGNVLAIQSESQKGVPIAEFEDGSQHLTFDPRTTLSSGVYLIEVTVQDMHSGATGSTSQQLFVP